MSITIINQEHTRLGFDNERGLPVLLENSKTGTQFLANTNQPFFKLLFKEAGNKEIIYSGLDASTAFVKSEDRKIIIYYNFIGMKALSVRCEVTRNDREGFDFSIYIRNATRKTLLEVFFPVFNINGLLESAASDWISYGHGFRHGILIHGFHNAFTPEEDEWHGSYIEPVQMVACGDSRQTIYFATRDTKYYCKHIKPEWNGEYLEISNRHFVDEDDTSKFNLPYPAEVCLLNNPGWQEAALKYREWTLKQWWCEKRLDERDDIPSWWFESPVVLSIKEQAKRNSDMMQRVSPWCHPLIKGIPRILEVAKNLDSLINVQVFHWEKNGAFVNVDHFPPLSGWEGTAGFFDQLHKNGHFGGLYILPLRWCIKAHATGYDGSEFFEQTDALGALALNEQLEPVKSPWDWEWRKRFLMCGKAESVQKEIIDSFHKVSELGADYIQFDTFNGMLYDCYDDNHGHFPGRGRWQIEESIRLIKECRKTKKPFIMTFEAAPVPELMPYIHGFVERGLQYRNEVGREYIPLFQFLYHPYCQGFSGEECGLFTTVDQFYLVNAITIVNGDLLMVNLDEEGKYAMMTHEPDTHSVTLEKELKTNEIEDYFRRLNRLRKETARNFLTTGTMEKDPEIICDTGKYMNDVKGNLILVPAIIGRAWSSVSGEYGIVIVNHTEKEQTALIRPPKGSGKELSKIDFDTGTSSDLARNDKGYYQIKVPAHTSAVLRQT